MAQLVRWTLVLLVIACVLPRSAVAEDRPVTLDEVRQMRHERSSAKEIVEAIDRRGLGFTVDEASEKRLRAMGFSPKQIDHLKGLRAADPAEPADGGEGPAKAGPPGARAKIQGVPRVLDARTNAEYAAVADRVRRIVIESATEVKPHPTAHINLLANPRVAALYRPNVERLEKLLAERFPDPIATNVDPRMANIVLLETRYEFERWIKALFKVHQADGLKFEGQDPLKTALATDSIFVRGIFSVCTEKMSAEDVRRSVAFSVGYLYLDQLTDHHAPAALQTGFGNITEAMLFPDPWTTVVSGYTDRHIDAARARWSDLVRQRFAGNKAGSVTDVLNYSTQTMNVEQYAEAWTLTATLAADPRNFCELLDTIARGTAAPAAIGQVYGVKEEEVHRHWQQFVTGKQ